MLKAVLDTNILLVSISSKSKYHTIFQYLLEGRFECGISTEILEEYEEIISQKYSREVAINTVRTLLLLPNVVKIEPHFRWSLLKDSDDNKFVNCALMHGADFIVTNDKGFDELKNIEFPKIPVIDIQKFLKMITST